MDEAFVAVAAVLYLPVLCLVTWLRLEKLDSSLTVDFSVFAVLLVDGIVFRFIAETDDQAAQVVGLVGMLAALLGAFAIAQEPIRNRPARTVTVRSVLHRLLDLVLVLLVFPSVLWFVVCVPVAYAFGFRSDGKDHEVAAAISMGAWLLAAIAVGVAFFRHQRKRPA